jgi:hypothetical protein
MMYLEGTIVLNADESTGKQSKFQQMVIQEQNIVILSKIRIKI